MGPRRHSCDRHQHPKLRRPVPRARIERELRGYYRQAGLRGRPEIQWHESLARTHDRNNRRYAQVMPYGDPPVFQIAPQAVWLPGPNRRGLWAHEIGHVLDPHGSEAEADAAARQALGVRIGYDHRWPGKGLQVARNPDDPGTSHHERVKVAYLEWGRTGTDEAYERFRQARRRIGLGEDPVSWPINRAVIGARTTRRKRMSVSEASGVVAQWLIWRGWIPDPRARLIVWISPQIGPPRVHRRVTFKRSTLVFEIGGRGRWQRHDSSRFRGAPHAWGDPLSTIDFAERLIRNSQRNLEDPYAKNNPQNPDARERKLERQAAAGDLQAQDRLWATLQRRGGRSAFRAYMDELAAYGARVHEVKRQYKASNNAACNRAMATLRKLSARVRRSKRSVLLDERHGHNSLERWARKVLGDAPVDAVMGDLKVDRAAIHGEYSVVANAMIARQDEARRLAHRLAWDVEPRPGSNEVFFRFSGVDTYRTTGFGAASYARSSSGAALVFLASQGFSARAEHIPGEAHERAAGAGGTFRVGAGWRVLVMVDQELDAEILRWRDRGWTHPWEILGPGEHQDFWQRRHEALNVTPEVARARFEQEGPLKPDWLPAQNPYVRNNPQLPKDAHPCVRTAQRDYRRLPEAGRRDAPFLWYLLGPSGSTQHYKMSKKDADYQLKPHGKQKCGNCEFAYAKVAGTKHMLCSLVRGTIRLQDWCRLWGASSRKLPAVYHQKNPAGDRRVRELSRRLRAEPGNLSVRNRLMRELGRRGQLWATVVSGGPGHCATYAVVSVRVHGEWASPRGKGRETLREIAYGPGGGVLDLKNMGPRSGLRQVLERLRDEFGARSRFLELREDWERNHPWRVSDREEWASAARAFAATERKKDVVGWNPSGDARLRKLERQFKAGDHSVWPTYEAELRRADRGAEANKIRDYLRHYEDALRIVPDGDPGRANQVALLLTNQLDPFKVEGVEDRARQLYSEPTQHWAAMQAFDILLGGFGVETINEEGFVAEYVNMGDTYNGTVLHDYRNDDYTITTYGDWVENVPNRIREEGLEDE